MLEEEKKEKKKEPEEIEKTEEVEETNTEEKSKEDVKDKKSGKKEYNGSKLSVYFPLSEEELVYENVTDYQFAQKGTGMMITSIEEDSVNTSRIYYLDTQSKDSLNIFNRPEVQCII